MAALAERSQPIDLVTLKDELVRAPRRWRRWAAPPTWPRLLDGMPRITNVEHWSRIIKEKAVLRNLIHASNRIVQSCYEAEDDAAVLLDRAEKAIFDIAEHRIRQGFVGIREIVKESFRTIDQLSQSQGAGHRPAHRLRGPRREDERPAEGRPHHRGRPPGHGQDVASA